MSTMIERLSNGRLNADILRHSEMDRVGKNDIPAETLQSEITECCIGLGDFQNEGELRDVNLYCKDKSAALNVRSEKTRKYDVGLSDDINTPSISDYSS